MARLSFRCSEELLVRVDAARGGVPREAWLRGAVEDALRGSPSRYSVPAAKTTAVHEADVRIPRAAGEPQVKEWDDFEAHKASLSGAARAVAFRRATQR